MKPKSRLALALSSLLMLLSLPVAAVQAQAGLPAIPTGLTATAVNGTTVNLTWIDNAVDELTYDVNRSLDAGFAQQRVSFDGLPANTTSFTDVTAEQGTTYFYQVQAANAAGDATSATVQVTMPVTNVPFTPTNLNAAVAGPNQVNLTWIDNSGNTETGFRIERSTSVTFATKIALPVVAANATNFSDTTAPANTTLFYRVFAVNAIGDSAGSNTVTVTTPPLPIPRAPDTLTATVSAGGTVNLTWRDRSNDEAGFRIQRAANNVFTGATSIPVAANATTFADTTAPAGATLFYRVLAANADGDLSGASNTVTVTTQAAAGVPAAPSGLAATAVSATQIDLAWTDNSNNETGFNIERSGDGATFTAAGSVGAGVTTFSVTGLAAGSQFSFRVTASNTAGVSAPSNIATATTQAPAQGAPAAPTGVAAGTVTATSAALTWTDASNNETGFRIDRSTDGVTFVAASAVMPANTTSGTAAGLTANTVYTFRVVAIAAGTAGPLETASAAIQVTTAAAAPPAGGTGGAIGGGIGGGIGGSAGLQLSTTGLVGSLSMDATGKALTSGEVKTSDSTLSLSIPAGTMIKSGAGAAQLSLSASVIPVPPAAPPSGAVVLAFEMGPSGTTFTPAVSIQFAYIDDKVPAGMAESSLFIAMWDGAKWVKLASTVDTVNNTVTAQVEHFSSFGLLAQAQPPTVIIESPVGGATVPAGNVTVHITTTNFQRVAPGGANVAGQGHVHYYLDVAIPTTQGQPATTAPGTYKVTNEDTVVWENLAPGTHTLGVQLVNNDHTPLSTPVTVQITITVQAPATTTPTTTPATTPATTQPTIPSTTSPGPTTSEPSEPNWLILGGVIAALAVIGLILLFSRKKPA